MPSDLSLTIHKAKQLLTSGQAAKVIHLLQPFITQYKKNIDLQLTLGIALIQDGRLIEAEEHFRNLLLIKPDYPLIYCNLAVVLTKLGQNEDAIKYYQEAIKLNHNLPEAYYNLGILYRELEQYQPAIDAFHETIRLKPDFYQAYNSLGNTYRDYGNFDSAIDSYITALKLEPRSASAHINLATALLLNNESARAITHYRKAIEIQPKNTDAYIGIGHAYLKVDNYSQAKNHYKKALNFDSENEEALLGIANACYESNELHKAYDYYKRILSINSENTKATINIAATLHELGRYQEAVDIYNNALTIMPDNVDILYNLGNTLIELGLIKDAIESFQKAIILCQNNEEIHWDLSRALLLSGNLDEGWAEYAWRLKRENKSLRKFPHPYWNNEPLKNKTIIIHAEQGIGDEIMFSSCIPDIYQKSGTLILDCEPRLAPIFRRSFPGVLVHGGRQDEDISWINEYPPADYQLPLGSLPGFFRVDMNSFPQRMGFLAADPGKLDYWRTQLSLLPNTISVGVSWKGGGTPKSQKKRSITLELFKDIFSVPGINYINLQYGDYEQELQTFSRKHNLKLHSFSTINPLVNMDNFAALISALDLVISVDNSTLHLSGALGKYSIGLLPYSPDWRWLLNGDVTPWYSSVRLLRQPAQGMWQPVLVQAKEELLSILSTRISSLQN
jgi:tetratricopeptide (TPR) repeat protein